jgi:hypothetical protein
MTFIKAGIGKVSAFFIFAIFINKKNRRSGGHWEAWRIKTCVYHEYHAQKNQHWQPKLDKLCLIDKTVATCERLCSIMPAGSRRYKGGRDARVPK